jgi:hypothetical protein
MLNDITDASTFEGVFESSIGRSMFFILTTPHPVETSNYMVVRE